VEQWQKTLQPSAALMEEWQKTLQSSAALVERWQKTLQTSLTTLARAGWGELNLGEGLLGDFWLATDRLRGYSIPLSRQRPSGGLPILLQACRGPSRRVCPPERSASLMPINVKKPNLALRPLS
jgi:hypothetical protein